jgi:Tol biopolymer transport system component
VAYDPVWSPDGSRIAFVSQQDGSDDIWVVYPDGSEPRNLTRNDWEWDKHPWWSPDGRRIIFWSNRAGVWQIYLMDANGQNLRRLSNTTWDEYEPIWIK